MEPLHDRMPVILKDGQNQAWLDPGTPTEALKGMTTPFPAKAMRAYPVSTLVNSPRHNSPECLEKQVIPEQEELF